MNQFRCGINLFSVKVIASIVGQLISMQAIRWEQARMKSRYLYECILHRASWNAKVLVSTEAAGECIFWYANVRKMNEIGSQLCQFSYNEPQELHVYCDASKAGYWWSFDYRFRGRTIRSIRDLVRNRNSSKPHMERTCGS